MSNVAVIAKINAQPGKRDELVQVLQGALDTAQAEEGTLVYLLHADTADPDVLWMYEVYADDAALGAHTSSDAFKALGPSIAPLLAGRPELTFLAPIGGKGL
jgi:quinol monooxygenase YgiN